MKITAEDVAQHIRCSKNMVDLDEDDFRPDAQVKSVLGDSGEVLAFILPAKVVNLFVNQGYLCTAGQTVQSILSYTSPSKNKPVERSMAENARNAQAEAKRTKKRHRVQKEA